MWSILRIVIAVCCIVIAALSISCPIIYYSPLVTHKRVPRSSLPKGLLEPGAFSQAATTAFQERIRSRSIQSLEQLSSADLCQIKFIGVYIRNSAWGNTFNAIANSHFIALLTNRTVIAQQSSDGVIRPSIPIDNHVRKLLRHAKCPHHTASYLKISMNDPNLLTRMANEWFVLIQDAFDWRSPELFLKSEQREDDILYHPAFSAISVLNSITFAPIVLQALHESVLPLQDDISMAIHVRHRDRQIDDGVRLCLEYVALGDDDDEMESRDPPLIYVASDLPDVSVPKIRQQNRGTIALFNYTLFQQERPIMASMLAKLSDQSQWARPGVEGYWGDAPPAIGLIDLLAISVLKPKIFIGSATSTFSEVIIGLLLAFTDHDPHTILFMIADAHHPCRIVTVKEYWHHGIRK